MRKLLLAALLSAAATGGAMANCYENLGCDDSDYFSRSDLRKLSCQALWEVRNAIYFQEGYCFKTERALDMFGDDDCEYEDMGDVPLNKYEKQNISRIAAIEKARQCN